MTVEPPHRAPRECDSAAVCGGAEGLGENRRCFQREGNTVLRGVSLRARRTRWGGRPCPRRVPALTVPVFVSTIAASRGAGCDSRPPAPVPSPRRRSVCFVGRCLYYTKRTRRERHANANVSQHDVVGSTGPLPSRSPASSASNKCSSSEHLDFVHKQVDADGVPFLFLPKKRMHSRASPGCP